MNGCNISNEGVLVVDEEVGQDKVDVYQGPR